MTRDGAKLVPDATDNYRYPQSTEPPLTLRISPVMYDACRDARYTTADAISSGSPGRPSGIDRMISRFVAVSERAAAVISVRTQPGATQLTVMRCGASSTASDFVSEISAPLLAA